MGGLHHSVLGSSRLTNPADNPKDREILSRGWDPPLCVVTMSNPTIAPLMRLAAIKSHQKRHGAANGMRVAASFGGIDP